MKFKHKFYIFIGAMIFLFLLLYAYSPRTVSWMFSYSKECKVLRVETFAKAAIMTNLKQANKFSIICDDGFICRAEDTAFAGIKAGDEIIFRGFPEVRTLEEFWKCDHAVLRQFKTLAPRVEESPVPTVTPTPAPAAVVAPVEAPKAALPPALTPKVSKKPKNQ